MHTLANFRRYFAAAACVALMAAAATGQDTTEEYRVKAAFLYNFAKFVEWPAAAFKGPEDPVAVCVLGQNPFGNILEEMVGQNTAGGRSFVVHQLVDSTQAGSCHILFISASERKRVKGILAGLRTQSTLTVSDIPYFALAGGAFGFTLENGKVRIEINLTVTKEKDLRVSSRLLSLARSFQ
jgi:hypothetical protein